MCVGEEDVYGRWWKRKFELEEDEGEGGRGRGQGLIIKKEDGGRGDDSLEKLSWKGKCWSRSTGSLHPSFIISSKMPFNTRIG